MTAEAATPHKTPRDVEAGRQCFVQSVVLLVAFNLTRAFGVLGPRWLAIPLLTVALVLLARHHHLDREELGLSSSTLGAGLRYGLAAFGLVVAVLLVAAGTTSHGFLDDARADLSGERLVYELTVAILLLTSIPEELAFRGVLLGSAMRMWGARQATVVTALLFGLWHIAPTLHTAADNGVVDDASSTGGGLALVVIGAVAATFVAGLVFCWLRLRSRSLLASVIAHWSTNAVALTAAWFVTH